MFVLFNGKFVKAGDAKISVMDNGFLYGDGVYETLRTYGGKIWQVDEHLRRLRSSAKMLKIDVPWMDGKIIGWLKKLCRMNGFKETRIRISVTRGSNGMDFGGSRKPTILIQAVELKEVAPSLKKKGVKVITVKYQRLLPEAKTISLLPMILARQAADKAKVYEALFVDGKGYVLEGTVTNVFMIKKGIVYTARKDVLPGTTAKALISALRGARIKVEKKVISLASLKNADEVFLTNAPRGIVPVASIDGKRIGGGKVGGEVQAEAGGLCKADAGNSWRRGSLTGEIMKIFEEYICKNI